MPRPTLDAVEARVAGALAEKALATPDQYPMTLASLVAACNQKTAREPVTDLSARAVTDALDRLGRRGLVGTTAGAGHRVAKFRHNLDRALDLSQRELAVLTVLLLRGTQTPGEIRTRDGAARRLRVRRGRRRGAVDARRPRRAARGHARRAARGSRPTASRTCSRGPSRTRPTPRPRPPGAAPDGPRPVSDFAALEARVAALEAQVLALREALGG